METESYLMLVFLGDKIQGDEAHFSSVPIHVVTNPSELPAEFLEPSPETQLVIGFDCEGVDLCRHGTLCIMQVNPESEYTIVSFRIKILN